MEMQQEAPEFKVGDWAYNEREGFNAQIVGVVWDKSAYNYQGGWRYWFPGYGTLSPYAERTSERYMAYAPTGENSYEKIGFID